MKNHFLKAVACAGLLTANCMWALPTLQLDIVDGVYDPVDETTMATNPVFTLRALLNGTLNANAPYHISAAIGIKMTQTDPDPDIGTVVINGVSFTASDFLYGTPPEDPLKGDLATHGVFPTYFLEFDFNFSAANTVAAYNVQDGSSGPGTLYYKDFNVDITGLSSVYTIHFDLYDNYRRLSGGHFAPFSHDAGGRNVPDGGSTVLLLGLGILGMAVVRWSAKNRV